GGVVVGAGRRERAAESDHGAADGGVPAGLGVQGQRDPPPGPAVHIAGDEHGVLHAAGEGLGERAGAGEQVPQLIVVCDGGHVGFAEQGEGGGEAGAAGGDGAGDVAARVVDVVDADGDAGGAVGAVRALGGGVVDADHWSSSVSVVRRRITGSLLNGRSSYHLMSSASSEINSYFSPVFVQISIFLAIIDLLVRFW